LLTRDRVRLHNLVFDPSDPSVVYGEGSYLWKSTDGGETWEQITDDHWLNRLVQPLGGDVLYAFHGGEPGIFASRDHGKSWTRARGAGLPRHIEASGLAFEPPASLYLCEKRLGLFRSADGGESWAKIRGDPCNLLVASRRGESTILYVCVEVEVEGKYGYAIEKTSDSGVHWTRLAAFKENRASRDFVLDPVTGAPLLASSYEAVLSSQDGGRNWRPLDWGIFLDPDDQQAKGPNGFTVDPHGSRVFYAWNRELGVAKSADGGATWTWLGLYDSDLARIVVDPTDSRRIYALRNAWTKNGGILESYDGGQSWK
jgi:photosystem II stability/assembly factor-like uncharacterized protein